MVKNNDKSNSLEYLFDKIFESLDKVTSRLDKVEDLSDRAIRELEKDIGLAREEMKIFLVHYDILSTLAKNLSPEGLRELVEDVISLKNFMTTMKEREEKRRDLRDTLLKIGIPLLIFGLGVIWWLFQNFLIVSPK